MHYQVDSKWLKDHLVDRNVRIIDCTYKLGEPEAGRAQYEQAHIPGAVYFDLEKDLSGAVETHGGRHPLPKQNQLKKSLKSRESVMIRY